MLRVSTQRLLGRIQLIVHQYVVNNHYRQHHVHCVVLGILSTGSTLQPFYGNKVQARLVTNLIHDGSSTRRDKARALLNCKITWSTQQLAVARFLVESFLLHDKESKESVRLMLNLMNRWIEDRKVGTDVGDWLFVSDGVFKTLSETTPDMTEDAVKLWKRLDLMQEESLRPSKEATGRILSMLASWAPNSDTDTVAALAEDIFQRSLDSGVQKDGWIWNAYLGVFAKLSVRDEAFLVRAHDILDEMLRLKVTSSHSLPILLHSLAKMGRPQQAESILQQMIDTDPENVTDMVFSICINAYALQGNGEKAQELLQRMRELNIQPNAVIYATVTKAWANSDHPEAAELAEAVLQTLDCPPTTDCLNHVIVAWMRSKKAYGAQRALQLLQTMEQQYCRGDENLCPTAITYTATIHALSLRPDQDAIDKAENLLRNMKEIAQSGRKNFEVTHVAYSAVLEVLAKSKLPGTDTRALELLREMQTLTRAGIMNLSPNSKTYNLVIVAYANFGRSQQARALLDEMLREYSKGNEDLAPNELCYNSVMKAYVKSNDPESSRQALALLETIQETSNMDATAPKPNVLMYSSAIKALSHLKSPEAANKSEAVLKRLIDEYRAGNVDGHLDKWILRSLLVVFERCLDKAEVPDRTDALIRWVSKESLNGLESIKPGRDCYNFLLNAWVVSGKENVLARVSGILREMSLSSDEDCKPDTFSYIRLMTVMNQSGDVHDACAKQLGTLQFLLGEYAKGIDRLKPSTTVLKLILKSCMAVRKFKPHARDACIVLEEVGKIILASEKWLLSPQVFEFYFLASSNLAFNKKLLIDEIYRRSKDTMNWDSSVEQAYERLQTMK